MPGDIVLQGFVLTAEEWAAMDPSARSQLLRAAMRRDEPWIAVSTPRLPVAAAREVDDYEAYELELALA